jgi:uncharacterized protein (TIGR03437 family)
VTYPSGLVFERDTGQTTVVQKLHCLALLIATATAFGAAVSVDGVCQVGNCASPDVVSSGNSPSTAFNFVITLPNTDQYRIAGSVNPSTGSNTVGISSPFTVAYLGNATSTASGADVITLDVLQNFNLSFPFRMSTESAQGGFAGAIGSGSSVSIQLVISGQALPVVGPFVAPANFSFQSQAYPLNPVTNPVQFDVHHTFTFAAGSQIGATIYNALTPGSSTSGGSNALEVCIGYDGGGGTLPIYRTPGRSPRDTSASSGCGVIVCEDGSGGTLPIYREGPQPRDTVALTNSCTLTTIDTVSMDGSGSSLPILYPTGPAGGNGSTTPVVVFQGGNSDVASEGSGSTLPILYPTGPAGGGGTGVVIACEGGGSTLPIYRSGGNSARATPAGAGFSIEIATPLQSIASNYTAVATCPDSTSSCWLTIPVASGVIAASTRTAITAIVNPQGLQPGTYTANVAITITPASGQTFTSLLNVPVTLALSPPGPNMVLSQTGLQFFAISGAAETPTQFISVTNSGSGTLDFNATASTLTGNWLGILRVPSPSGVELVGIQANPTGLAPGVYSGLVEFTSPGAVNGTQSVEVTFTVFAGSTNATPSISSTALIFVAPQGSNPATAAPAQMVTLSNPSSQTLTVTTSISFASGNGWFTATASAGSVTSAQPLTETIAVNSASLAPGVYLGSMDVHISETNTDYPVEVLLVVKASSCTPTQLFPVITNLGGGFQATAGIPVPLTAQVVDDCGTPLASGSLLAYFPGGDPSVTLISNGQGQWSGTWMPHSITTAGPALVGLLATSFTPAIYGSSGVNGTVAANPTAPLILSGGAVSSASFVDAPLAPGLRVSIFGANLTPAPAENDTSPYPISLGGTQVFVGGEAIPLQVVSAGQINAVLPYDLPLGVPQQVIVAQGGAYSMPETVVLTAAEPSVFTLNQSGQGQGAIVVVKPSDVEFVNGPANPASAGDTLVIYCTGLGIVSPLVPAQLAAPLSPLSRTTNPVTVTIGGISVRASFAGLAPGFVGLYQVNATVPTGVAPGANVPVVVSAAGATSVPVTVAIQE